MSGSDTQLQTSTIITELFLHNWLQYICKNIQRWKSQRFNCFNFANLLGNIVNDPDLEHISSILALLRPLVTSDRNPLKLIYVKVLFIIWMEMALNPRMRIQDSQLNLKTGNLLEEMEETVNFSYMGQYFFPLISALFHIFFNSCLWLIMAQ